MFHLNTPLSAATARALPPPPGLARGLVVTRKPGIDVKSRLAVAGLRARLPATNVEWDCERCEASTLDWPLISQNK